MNLSEDKIIFKRRDPDKIGNGSHDYDVYHDDEHLGECFFGPIPQSMFSHHNLLFTRNGIRYNMPISLEVISTMKTNEEIFTVLRPEIVKLIKAVSQREE